MLRLPTNPLLNRTIPFTGFVSFESALYRPFYTACVSEASCERNLEELIESLGASNAASAAEAHLSDEQSATGTKQVDQKHSEVDDEATTEGEEMRELIPEESEGEAQVKVGPGEDNEEEEEEEVLVESELMLSLEEMHETNIQEVGAEQQASGLRRRNRPD